MDVEKANEGLPDINESETGFIKKHIHKVGINNYKVPIKIYYPGGNTFFSTISAVSAYASLPEDKKGINMSRFSIIITECAKDSIGLEAISKMLLKLKEFVKNNDHSVLLVTQDIIFAKKISDKITLINASTLSEFINTNDFIEKHKTEFITGEGNWWNLFYRLKIYFIKLRDPIF